MIIVTGGAGFIGSHLVDALLQRGENEILLIDRLGQGGKWRNIRQSAFVDILPPEILPSLLAEWRDKTKIRAIFHLGAISRTTEKDVDRIIAANIHPSLALWHWCAQTRTRLLYASSAATYGDGSQGFDDDGSSAALARLRPLNPYGWSKHMVDRRIAQMVERGDPRPPQWVGLKFFNVYGPHEAHKGDQMSVVSKFVPHLAAGKAARLFRSARADIADGEQKRDFVWVGDCIKIMLWLFDHPEVSGLFNAGSGVARSFNDLARAAFAALGLPERIEYSAFPEELAGGYQYFTQARMERLRQAGYTESPASLEEGISRWLQVWREE